MTDTTGKMRENRVISEGIGGIYPHGPVYHWRDGWLFCRGEGLDVHVWNHEKEIDLTIPRVEWESIVAALSTAPTGERELSEGEIERIIRKHVRNYEACGLVSLIGFDEAARAIIDRLTGRSEG